jgi:fatty-acid peroxygenase
MTHVANRETGIPRLPTLDSTLAFARDGYTFGERQFSRLGTDAFRTRMLGLPVTIMRGADAARVFYEEDRFSRERAMPATAQHLLQDKGSTQVLNGETHRHRKHFLLKMLADPEALGRLREFFAEEWFRALEARPGTMTLHDELITILTRASLRWVGTLPDEHDVDMLAGELGAMIENAGRFGPPNWFARTRRIHSEAWATALIADVRAERRVVARGSVLRQLADYIENGRTLSERDAGIELLNVLRPTVAVGRFIVFAALALHRHPQWRERVMSGDGADIPVDVRPDAEHFVNEVRRFYPFFPMVGGRALRPFTWRGRNFKVGNWVMLDLYGTNHDESIWPDAHRFRPERFEDWDGDPNSLIPQGGGDEATGHRCPGERATIELMTEGVRLLTRETGYTVPEQDLRVSLKRFLSMPESGFVLANPVRRNVG